MNDDDMSGYYTLDELKTLEQRLAADPDLDKSIRLKVLERIQEMEHYDLKITYAYGLTNGFDIDSDELDSRIINLYKLVPHKFGTNDEFMGVTVVSAPNLREADCCASCMHSISENYDNRCDLHTSTAKVYEPFLVEPLEPFDHQICDDYKRRTEDDVT